MFSAPFARGFVKQLRRCRLHPYHVEDMRYIMSLPSAKAVAGGGGLSKCCEVVDASVNMPIDPMEVAFVSQRDFIDSFRDSSDVASCIPTAQRAAAVFWMLRRLKEIPLGKIGSGGAQGVARTFCERTQWDTFPASQLFLQSGTAFDFGSVDQATKLKLSASATDMLSFCRKNIPTSLRISTSDVCADLNLSLYEPRFAPHPNAADDDGVPFKECSSRFKLDVTLSSPVKSGLMLTVVSTHFFVASPSEGILFEHSCLMDPSDMAKIHLGELQPVSEPMRVGGRPSAHQSTAASADRIRALGSGASLLSMHSDTRSYFISLPKFCTWGLLKGILFLKSHDVKDRSSLRSAPIFAVQFGVLRMTEDDM
jgi:hypothetical protein